MKVFAWGANSEGQLGSEELSDKQIVPISAVVPGQVTSTVICASKNHSILVSEGEVYVSGSNQYGQLGLSNQTKLFTLLPALQVHTITSVHAGADFSIAINDCGQVFTWGENLVGQLGRTGSQNMLRIPKLVKELAAHKIIQVSVGSSHCLALSDDGNVYTWGSNSEGQLGLGKDRNELEFTSTPTQILSLRGLAPSQVVCGEEFSMMRTVSGAVFCWGSNSHGQLGLNDTVSRVFPTHLKHLRHQKVAYVACGSKHSAALTVEGGILTFGLGSAGQLGHLPSLSDEYLPRRVAEFLGSNVIQIACSSNTTYVITSSTQGTKLHSFGANEETPVRTGSPIKGQTKQFRRISLNFEAKESLWRVFSGPMAQHCFVTVSGDGSQAPDFSALSRFSGKDVSKICPDRPEILRLVPSTMSQMCAELRQLKNSHPDDTTDFTEVLERLQRIFCSQSCLNASWLSEGFSHFDCSPKHHGVDIEACRASWHALLSAAPTETTEKIFGYMVDVLFPSLPSSPPDVEALRLYLTLPLCPRFDNPDFFRALLAPWASSVSQLDRPAARVLDHWWSRLPAKEFTRLVDCSKKTIVHVLSLPTSPNDDRKLEMFIRNRAINHSLKILDKLKKANDSRSEPIDYTNFYIEQLIDLVPIKADYLSWVQERHSQNGNPQANGMHSSVFHFCDFPFIFDGQAKTALLHMDAYMQMRVAVDEVQRRNLHSTVLGSSIFGGPIGLSTVQNPFLQLTVNRDNIVQDTLAQLARYRSTDFKKPLQIRFQGEPAEDAGGVKKEFFLLIFREILDAKYGMFRNFDESRLVWFANYDSHMSTSDQVVGLFGRQMSFFKFQEDNFLHELYGTLCGLAIYNGTIVDLPFPLALYKKLLGTKPNLDDIKELDPTMGRSLAQLLEYEEKPSTTDAEENSATAMEVDSVEDLFGLTFSTSQDVFGEIITHDLVPGGREKSVTADNRAEYVDLYVEWVFTRSVDSQFERFARGFHDVLRGRVLQLFTPEELQAMVVGNARYDWIEFQKLAQYKGEYHANHATIQMFWSVFHDLSLHEKKKFLMFLTGSDRIPILGMKSVRLTIQPTRGGEDFLPVAHTCFNLLDLPIYTTKEKLKEKLLTSLQQSEGFALV